MAVQNALLTETERRQFREQGYLIRRGQLPSEEVDSLFSHFAALRERGSVPGCFEVQNGQDPLLAWPRMMHPHRIDERSRELLLDPRLIQAVSELYGEPALAAQSMFYWKPPGARGQALHQDDFYLRTQPGECLAAWVALDPADPENGGLRVVPTSHHGTLQCPHPADPELSFSHHEVELQPGWQVLPLELAAGDILFFPGRLIHGSLPNQSTDRWRRSYICHYVPASSAECARGYQPLLDAQGHEHRTADPGPESDPCGGPEYAMY